jgi:hypothetical protein
MASTNGITGDSLINKPNTKEFEENFDRIFRKDRLKEGTEKPNGEQFGNLTDPAVTKET